jgi:hypothetical protein
MPNAPIPKRKGKAERLRQKSYLGILAEPMPMLTWSTDEEVQALIDAKMAALFAHYGIEAADAFESGPKMAATWANLAWHLAREHVPGFKGAPRKRGKPATRKSDDVTLAMHVELLKRRDGLSERKAIKQIAAQKLVSGTEDTLRQRYKRSKKKFAPMARLYDNFAAMKGRDTLVQIMEGSLSGDDKDTVLSPG